jgi:nicotinate-nucleotide pyrophosphorylase (carboxylating)
MSMKYLKHKQMRDIISYALAEDIGSGDVTTESLFVSNRVRKAIIIAKEDCVLCGAEAIRTIFKLVDTKVHVNMLKHDGNKVKDGQTICAITGPIYSILKAERICLNYIGYLSGISTMTHHYVEKIKGTNAHIYDTRKTTPGYRLVEKYAVLTGGGYNQRVGLYDQVLIKDNHFKALSKEELADIPMLIRRVRKKIPKTMKIQVEADCLRLLRAIIPAHPDLILLDNMNPATLKEAIKMIRAENKKAHVKIEIEASGGITLSNVRAIAKLGVDRISIGAITHSTHNIDFSLDVE